MLEDLVGALAKEEEEDGHAGGDAIAYLIDDHRPGEVGHFGADLDAAVHRAGMHHEGVVAHGVDPAQGEAVAGGVLAERGDEVLGHALLLHPEEPHHVEAGQDGIEIVAHRHRPPLERGRQQRGRGDEGDLGAEGGVGQHIGAGYSAVLDVADDADVHAIERASLLANRVAVQQGLRGVLVPAIARIDHVDSIVQPARDLPRHARRAVADNDGVDAHRFDGEHRIAERLALLDRRRADAERHRVGREALGRLLEAQPSAGGVFVEEPDDVLPSQRGNLRDGALRDLGERVGELVELLDVGPIEIGDGEEVPHDFTTSPRSTPCGLTFTTSSRRVGRFLPT